MASAAVKRKHRKPLPSAVDDTDDGGWSSRKMLMAYAAMALILAGFCAAGYWASLGTVYAEYVMGILGAASIYTGGSAATRWMHLKHQRLSAQQQADPLLPTQPPLGQTVDSLVPGGATPGPLLSP